MARSILLERAGIIVIDKPAGPTSADVLAILKRKLQPARIGHAGTLDPMATGVLICLLNNATRLASFAEHGDKVYSGTIRLGLVTASDDITGAVLKDCAERPGIDRVIEESKHFIGEIKQVPPQVSAVRLQGERAYDRVRRGESVVIEPRTVRVNDFKLWVVDQDNLGFRVECSRGTYIRSLARDLGEILGCGATLASLRREASKPFSIEQAVALADVSPDSLKDWGELFPSAARLTLQDNELGPIKNGVKEATHGIVNQAIVDGRVSGADSLIVYSGALEHRSLGLLELRESRWVIGANIG